VLHFKIVSDLDQIKTSAVSVQDFFAPKFLHWIFGENEQIQGYEGLQINIFLSAKRLIPYVEITYEKKAPAFAKIDDPIAMLKKHYGTLYTDATTFEEKVLSVERS